MIKKISMLIKSKSIRKDPTRVTVKTEIRKVFRTVSRSSKAKVKKILLSSEAFLTRTF